MERSALCVSGRALNFIRRCCLFLQGFFVAGYPLFWGHFGDELTDEGVGDVGGVFEADAAFAHVQFAGGVFWVFIGEPFEQGRIGIDAHVVEGDEILLGGDA